MVFIFTFRINIEYHEAKHTWNAYVNNFPFYWGSDGMRRSKNKKKQYTYRRKRGQLVAETRRQTGRHKSRFSSRQALINANVIANTDRYVFPRTMFSWLLLSLRSNLEAPIFELQDSFVPQRRKYAYREVQLSCVGVCESGFCVFFL